jgi:hypothetical protein
MPIGLKFFNHLVTGIVVAQTGYQLPHVISRIVDFSKEPFARGIKSSVCRLFRIRAVKYCVDRIAVIDIHRRPAVSYQLNRHGVAWFAERI